MIAWRRSGSPKAPLTCACGITNRMNLSKSIPPTLLSPSSVRATTRSTSTKQAIPLSLLCATVKEKSQVAALLIPFILEKPARLPAPTNLMPTFSDSAITMTTSTTGAVTATAAKIARNPRAVVGVAYVRPVYAPALVAWVGGPHFSVGIGIGGGGGVGVAWFPLGPREVFVPSYHVSRTYVTNVNVSNTTVNNTVVNNYYNNVVVNKNVTNIKYVNQTAPNGVTATSQQNFTSAQPVGRNMIKVDQREVASAQVRPTTPTVAPQQRSVLGAGAAGAARPPARFQERPVVARTAPPPAPVSFVKQQQSIQANGGLPPAVSQMRQVQTENAQQARANIKIAPPANAGMPQNIQANRPGSVQNNRVNRPGQQQTNVQNNSNKPPTPNNAVQPPPGNQPVNPPANNGRNKSYNDRPSTARPDGGSPNTAVNGQLDQKHQQQLEQPRQRQDQERQRIEQKQVQEQQKIQQKNAEDSRKQQVEQKQQQQLQQLQQKT